MKLTLESLKINPEQAAGKIEGLTLRLMEASGASGVAVGVSGGLDSSTVLTLMARALGGGRVYAVAMPERGVSSLEDLKDAEEISKRLGVNFFKVEISPVVKAFEQVLPVFERENLIAWGNLKPRIRMATLYYFANRFNLVVAGTGNRSELLVGYFTKYGDGVADFLPLGGLYKIQVKQLASHLGVPRKILDKTPTAGLWPGQTDEGELGLKYETLDLVLYGLVDLGLQPEEIASQLGLPESLVLRVKGMVDGSLHKRRPAPIFEIF